MASISSSGRQKKRKEKKPSSPIDRAIDLAMTINRSAIIEFTPCMKRMFRNHFSAVAGHLSQMAFFGVSLRKKQPHFQRYAKQTNCIRQNHHLTLL
jgi:hypothetical protein